MGRRRQRPRPRTLPWQPVAPAARPTVVTWEMDHGYDFPVLDVSRGADAAFLDAAALGIPANLGRRIEEWAERWEISAMRHGRGEVPTAQLEREDAQLLREEHALLDELRRELDPDVELLAWGVPLDEWRHGRRLP